LFKRRCDGVRERGLANAAGTTEDDAVAALDVHVAISLVSSATADDLRDVADGFRAKAS
jgi:hypothetical protein